MHLAQAMYEGYCRYWNSQNSLATGVGLPEWEFLPSDNKAAWESAAQHVSNATTVLETNYGEAANETKIEPSLIDQEAMRTNEDLF